MIKPLTSNEISELVPDINGETSGFMYLSIDHYDHKVFKCRCCGVRNASMSVWMNVWENEYPGHEIRVYPEFMGDRIDENGILFTSF